MNGEGKSFNDPKRSILDDLCRSVVLDIPRGRRYISRKDEALASQLNGWGNVHDTTSKSIDLAKHLACRIDRGSVRHIPNHRGTKLRRLRKTEHPRERPARTGSLVERIRRTEQQGRRLGELGRCLRLYSGSQRRFHQNKHPR